MRKTHNQSIRKALNEHHVYLYELSEKLGFSESTMTRKMRVEQDEETQAHWIEIIKKIGDKNERSEGKEH
jgi:DNA-binding NtrC family response regulator